MGWLPSNDKNPSSSGWWSFGGCSCMVVGCPASNNNQDYPMTVQVRQEGPTFISGITHCCIKGHGCGWHPSSMETTPPFSYIFIAMANFGLMRFTPSRLGGLVGVLFRFHIVHTPTMGKASHYCPFGYGEAILGKAFAPMKLGVGDATRLCQKGLGGKDVEVNLIPKIVPFDANQRLEILLETN
ncbi:hypothetical protein SLEP1_g5368 [Rubroshorea leprosula]|uniref:Uncharacterized protein n=1 Tax=Rubroshorea leprosula TaxID=152421 RepID=A0AAV5I0N6_9ROSI|nr:hypothetical protein SLEP1_g5368 [Rubroshorea leprosula]